MNTLKCCSPDVSCPFLTSYFSEICNEIQQQKEAVWIIRTGFLLMKTDNERWLLTTPESISQQWIDDDMQVFFYWNHHKENKAHHFWSHNLTSLFHHHIRSENQEMAHYSSQSACQQKYENISKWQKMWVTHPCTKALS